MIEIPRTGYKDIDVLIQRLITLADFERVSLLVCVQGGYVCGLAEKTVGDRVVAAWDCEQNVIAANTTAKKQKLYGKVRY